MKRSFSILENGNLLAMAGIACLAMPVLWGAGEAEYFVSRHPAKVLPRAMMVIPAESAGELEVCHFGGKGVAAGTLLARLNPKALELDEADYKQQVIRNELDAEGNILKLKRELEELDFIAGLNEKQRPFVEQRVKMKADARARDLLQRKISALEEQTRVANEKLRLLYERSLALRVLRMPYDGVVQYHIPLPEKEGMCVPVTASSPILTVADNSTLYIALVINDPELAKLEAKRFSVCLKQGDIDIRAAYSFRRIEKQGQNQQPVFYFAVPEEQKDAVWEMVGSNLIAELLYSGDGHWKYEAKIDLAREAGKQPFATWEELVAALRPGYRIVFNGETHLCLAPGREPAPAGDSQYKE